MKGGPSIDVVLDLALDGQGDIAATAADVLKSQIFMRRILPSGRFP